MDARAPLEKGKWDQTRRSRFAEPGAGLDALMDWSPVVASAGAPVAGRCKSQGRSAAHPRTPALEQAEAVSSSLLLFPVTCPPKHRCRLDGIDFLLNGLHLGL